MTLDANKFLQNVELKLRGRGAILCVGQAAMVFAFWTLLKDYAIHPAFSIIGGGLLLLGILGFLALGLLGKTRPDEVPDRSLTHVTQLGIVVAHGIDSQRDMIRMMRELSGMRLLPPPSHAVNGAAANEKDYVPLSPDESNQIVSQIERGIDKLLADVLDQVPRNLDRLRSVDPEPIGTDERPATKGRLPPADQNEVWKPAAARIKGPFASE